MRIKLLLLLGCVGMLIACTPSPELACFEQSATFIEETDTILERWEDADDIAASTSRIALAEPVSELQAIRRDAADLEAPECAEIVHGRMIAYMQENIDLYLDFMADASDAEMARASAAVSQAQRQFNSAYGALQSGQLSNYMETETAPTRTPSPTRTPLPTRPSHQVTYQIESDAQILMVQYARHDGFEEERFEPPWPELQEMIREGERASLSLEARGAGNPTTICRILVGGEILDEQEGTGLEAVRCRATVPTQN